MVLDILFKNLLIEFETTYLFNEIYNIIFKVLSKCIDKKKRNMSLSGYIYQWICVN